LIIEGGKGGELILFFLKTFFIVEGAREGRGQGSFSFSFDLLKGEGRGRGRVDFLKTSL
jgi:hypothetical protein